MRIRGKTLGLAAALVALLGPDIAPGETQPGIATQPTGAPQPGGPPTSLLVAPDPGTVRAFDRPSDDGTAIVIEWPQPEKPVKGLTYTLELARSPADFGTDKAVSLSGTPALESSQPKYFGFSEATRRTYFVEVTPAQVFKPKMPGALDGDRLAALTAEKVVTAEQARRAAAALDNKKPDEQLSRQEKAEREWLGRLRAYLKEKDESALKAEVARINAGTYYFRLTLSDGVRKVQVMRGGEPLTLEAAAKANLFAWYKLNNLIFGVLFSGIVLGFIEAAKRNPHLFIRKIAGLEAVEEAIGRATEMGRPVYFVHGLGGMSDLATIAAVNILARVARRAAEYDTRVRVMNNDPIVTAVSQEVVQQAYTEAGRPDAYNADDVSLVAYDQFSYVAAVGGMMVREQPAAIFMIGYFYAESLLLAETGASTGAIQVAGTDAYTQLPFFVTTCDYTLIGEELYAASAYLSREPRLLGSLRGQDVGKAFLMVVIVVGTIVLTVAAAVKGWNADWIRNLFEAF